MITGTGTWTLTCATRAEYDAELANLQSEANVTQIIEDAQNLKLTVDVTAEYEV